MNKKLFSSFLFLLSASYISKAQDTSNTIGHVSIASPTAASLGKYGDIPVSYHTGLPDISIPIYTVKSGSLQLPVGLSYHASGLKVQEAASWVGAGWSLNAGGAITRTVVGAPDDRGFSSSNVLNGHYTDYGYNSYYASQAQSVVDLNLTRGFADGEPDLYFFNFGGYTGKFYFNDDRTPMLIPEQDFKIQPFLASGQGFTGFIITTPDGVRYFFGQQGNNGSVSPIEITNPFTLQNGPSNTTAAASSWFLNKIISADGMDSITLSYQQENYSYYAVATNPVLNTNYNIVNNDYTVQNGMNITKNLVQGVRLSRISFANGTMTFTPAAGARSDLSNSDGVFSTTSMADNANNSAYALGSITVNDNNGFCKKDSLYTSYFYDNNSVGGSFFVPYSTFNLHTDAYRLRLDSIQETTCDATLQIPPYRFAYFSEPVPRRLSFGIDHWGYPNGVTSNTGLVPTFTVITNGTPAVTSGANREAAWPAMRGGSLQQISYPTGGSTAFDFEPKNVYTFSENYLDDEIIGGVSLHQPGQSAVTQTDTFTISPAPDGICHVVISNATINYEPFVKIFDMNNTELYNSLYIGTGVTIDVNLSAPPYSLSPGKYYVTIYYPFAHQGDALTGGPATATVWQMKQETRVTSQVVGGLRIKTITNKDALTSNDIVTSYNYTGGGSTTTGTLYSIPVYVQVLRNEQLHQVWVTQTHNPNGCASLDGFNAHNYYISPGSIQPLATVQGENFGYNEVDVTQTGNGRSVYRYYGSNLWNQGISDVSVRTLTQSSICSLSIPTFPAAPLPFEFMRDELEYEGYFNEAGQLLKEASHFPAYSPDPMVTPGHIGINLPGFYCIYRVCAANGQKGKRQYGNDYI